MSGALTAIKVVGVFLLLAATLMYIRRHDRGRLRVARKSQRPVSVLGQARLSKAASVAVVDIGGTAYAVAVTDQRVSLLLPNPVELPEIVAAPEPAAQPSTELPTTATEEQPADERPAPASGSAGRYVGRFERGARGATADRPSFGEALTQQFRVLTRRETPVALEHLPVRFADDELSDLDAQLSDMNADLNSVTTLIPAVTPAADGTAADSSARTPGTFSG